MKTAEEVIAFIDRKIDDCNHWGDTQFDRHDFGLGVAKALLWTCEINLNTYSEIVDNLEKSEN